MPTADLIFWYVVFFLIIIFGLFAFIEHQRRQFAPHKEREHIFRCSNCSMVYTDDADVTLSPCPKCGTANEEFEF